MSKTLLDDFWSREESIEKEKEKLQRARVNLSKKILELSYIEEFRTRLIYVRDLLQTDCSRTETFAQRYQILLAFSLFDNFEEIALEQHPTEQEFIRDYWAYIRLCCADALKIECTQAVHDGIPRMVESLRSAWVNRCVPEFQSFQIEYDTPLPEEEPIKRKPTPRGNRKTKQVKKEESYH
jgi:Mg2+ and Co2+ transporter CorA